MDYIIVRDSLLGSVCEIPQTVTLMPLITNNTLVICLLLTMVIGMKLSFVYSLQIFCQCLRWSCYSI